MTKADFTPNDFVPVDSFFVTTPLRSGMSMRREEERTVYPGMGSFITRVPVQAAQSLQANRPTNGWHGVFKQITTCEK
ncbi:hypothetical protein TNCV_578481 [Trichonephila clavipes]|nr:hypothetical protein TNCV_578481 [Trichonephila clavipes]